MVAWLVACLVVRVVLDADAAVAALVVAAWVVVALRCQDLSVLSFFLCLQHANMKLCCTRSAMNPMAALLQQQQLAASLLCCFFVAASCDSAQAMMMSPMAGMMHMNPMASMMHMNPLVSHLQRSFIM